MNKRREQIVLGRVEKDPAIIINRPRDVSEGREERR